MTPVDFVIHVFAVYAVTAIVAASHIAKGFRTLFRKMTWKILPFWIASKFVKYEFWDEQTDMHPVLVDYEDMDLTQDAGVEGAEHHVPIVERTIMGYDYIACRMCVGVSVTFTLWLMGWPFVTGLGIYGAAYWIVTLERA
jgi:hypothetical protein